MATRMPPRPPGLRMSMPPTLASGRRREPIGTRAIPRAARGALSVGRFHHVARGWWVQRIPGLKRRRPKPPPPSSRRNKFARIPGSPSRCRLVWTSWAATPPNQLQAGSKRVEQGPLWACVLSRVGVDSETVALRCSPFGLFIGLTLGGRLLVRGCSSRFSATFCPGPSLVNPHHRSSHGLAHKS